MRGDLVPVLLDVFRPRSPVGHCLLGGSVGSALKVSGLLAVGEVWRGSCCLLGCLCFSVGRGALQSICGAVHVEGVP